MLAELLTSDDPFQMAAFQHVPIPAHHKLFAGSLPGKIAIPDLVSPPAADKILPRPIPKVIHLNHNRAIVGDGDIPASCLAIRERLLELFHFFFDGFPVLDDPTIQSAAAVGMTLDLLDFSPSVKLYDII